MIRDGANRDQTVESFHQQTPTILKRSQIDIATDKFGSGMVCNTAPMDQISRNSEHSQKSPMLNLKGHTQQEIITDHNHPMFLEHQYRDNQHE